MTTLTRPRTAVGASDPACVTCGRVREIEWHHVAGWRNDPDLVVPLCLPCHKVITAWQYAAGIELEELKDGERDAIDRARAVLVGSLLLVELFLRRHPSLGGSAGNSIGVEAHDARLLARWISRAWDQDAERQRPDREGRWTPDARRARLEAISPSPSDRDPVASLVEWRVLLEVLQVALGLSAPTTADGVPMLDLDRPTRSPVITAAASQDGAAPGQAARARCVGVADILAVIAELHEAVKTTTDRALRPNAGSQPLTNAEPPVVLAVAAAAMRLILATLN